jgi:hypothetical protein
LVFLISFLLLAPLIKAVDYQPEKPLILVVQDNSASIRLFEPSGFDTAKYLNELSQLKKKLGGQYDVQEFHFGKMLDNGLPAKFNGQQTNISGALRQLHERYVNQNMGAIILATDGLFNQGSDPQYEVKNYKTTLYTIALGDIVPKRDLLVANVNYNKTVLLGNDFELEILVAAYQSKGESISLHITSAGKEVYRQNIPVNSMSFQKTLSVKLPADKKGLCKYTIGIAPVKNEISTQNNTESIFIDVLDARQKILLVSGSPHPDIAALKQAIEINRNYTVQTLLTPALTSSKAADFSLLVLYQVTANDVPLFKNILANTKIPVWYIIGAQSNLTSFNAEQKIVKIEAGREQLQEVFPQQVRDFSAFTLSDSAGLKLTHFPPLLAPYGNYTMLPGAQVLLKQKIGNIPINSPLLVFSETNSRRMAVLTGEGLWRWQLAEYQLFGNHHTVEELLGQTVQYLTANSNRERFRVYPAKNVFDEGENVIINAELYNDALELVNTPDVRIDMSNEQGKRFSFLFSRTGRSYQLDAAVLPPGDYRYQAATVLGKTSLVANGSFTIKPLNIESRQSAANHQLLYAMARQAGGKMLYPDQIGQLADLIRKNENIKTVVYEDKHYSDLISSKWLFVLIAVLLSAEWFLRKREGEI